MPLSEHGRLEEMMLLGVASSLSFEAGSFIVFTRASGTPGLNW